MSFVQTRGHFRGVISSIGLVEWLDAFNTQNIPSTIIDGSFHLDTTQAIGMKHNQQALEVTHTVIVSVFRKGFLESAEAVDQLHLDADNIIVALLSPENRLTETLKNIRFVNMSLEPLSASNDNAAAMRMSFDCLTVFNP